MTLESLLQSRQVWAMGLFALGMWLLLPRGNTRGKWLGLVITLSSFGLFASKMSYLGDMASNGLFAVLAAVTVVSAALTVTLRNPVYCAMWFALSLLGTAGLFMFDGAQFLAVATIVVYAGAILVTFLFVLMLASPGGHAFYDRLSWEGSLSAATGAVMVGVLTFSLGTIFKPQDNAPAQIMAVGTERSAEILASQHMAHLGAQLFSRHLIAVEVAGTLLLVALVGAVAIVSEAKVRRSHRASRMNRAAESVR
jgi:NADH-quinone oxidoreductase subunit J